MKSLFIKVNLLFFFVLFLSSCEASSSESSSSEGKEKTFFEKTIGKWRNSQTAASGHQVTYTISEDEIRYQYGASTDYKAKKVSFDESTKKWVGNLIESGTANTAKFIVIYFDTVVEASEIKLVKFGAPTDRSGQPATLTKAQADSQAAGSSFTPYSYSDKAHGTD